MKNKFLGRQLSLAQIILFILIAGYLIVRFAGFLSPDSTYQDYWGSISAPAISSIFDNLFAGLIFSALALAFKEHIVDFVTESSRIRSFHGYDGLCERLDSILFQHKDKKLHIIILTPILFSEEIAKTQHYNKESSADAIGRAAKLGNIIKELIKSANDSYEKIIVGKTSDKNINALNWKYIEETYFNKTASNIELPPTTGIGYHNNFNETAVIMIFTQANSCPSEPDDPLFLANAIFSNEYKSILGYTTENKRLIQETLLFNKARFDEVKKCRQYYENGENVSKWPSNQITGEVFMAEIKSFFEQPGDGYQFNHHR